MVYSVEKWPGVYIMQNTMVLGGGGGRVGKNEKYRADRKERDMVRES